MPPLVGSSILKILGLRCRQGQPFYKGVTELAIIQEYEICDINTSFCDCHNKLFLCLCCKLINPRFEFPAQHDVVHQHGRRSEAVLLREEVVTGKNHFTAAIPAILMRSRSPESCPDCAPHQSAQNEKEFTARKKSW